MRRQDPIQQRDDAGLDLHDIVEWTPKTLTDRLVFSLYATGFRVALVVLAVGVLLQQFNSRGGRTLVTDPVVVAFVVLSVLPALVLVAYVWYADVTTTPSVRLLCVTFLLGMVLVSLAGIANGLFGRPLVRQLSRYDIWQPAIATLLFVLVVAPVEETTKLLAVKLYATRRPAFDSVITGAVLGATAGLGFATMENAFYITRVVEDAGSVSVTASEGGVIAAVRALVGPGHVIYSAFAGYYLGLARFNRRYAGPILLKGLLLAVFLHAWYNVLVSPEALYVPGYLVDLVGFSERVAVFTFVLAYNGVLTLLLIHKLSQYRAVYRETHAEQTIRSELTEFDG
jgi:RsiW-degrading membrane proteinase PrsW (M82 family)